MQLTGWLDSAKGSNIGGWVRLPPEAGEALALLKDGSTSAIIFAAPLLSSRTDVPGSLGFTFGEVDPNLMLKLALGQAWVEIFSILAGTSKEIFNENFVPQPNVEDFKWAFSTFWGRVSVYDGFKRQALDAIALAVKAPPSVDHIALQIDQISPNASPWELILDKESFQTAPKETSQFEIPVGVVSRDQSTIVGKEGHLFLYKGNNYLLHQYIDSAAAKQLGQNWAGVLKRRKAFAQEVGCQFLQVVIPEKASALVEQFPQPLDAPTYSLRQFRSEIHDHDVVLDLLPTIRSDSRRVDFYRKIDAHFSYYGCHKVFRDILQRLGISDQPEAVMEYPKIIKGDIGGRFPGVMETQMAPDPAYLAQQTPVETYRHLPANHRHEGITVRWKNPKAPVKMKVIACANSFFALGSEAHQLSWWFSRWFEEFHFIWSRNLHMDHIRAECPDIVIAQTIERFLPVVPDR